MSNDFRDITSLLEMTDEQDIIVEWIRWNWYTFWSVYWREI